MIDTLREIRLRLITHSCTSAASKRKEWNRFVLAMALNRLDANRLVLRCKHCGDRIWP